MTTLALIGNPNCGKTTLFNVLTGLQQRVGNWPGVTVERKTGEFQVDGTIYAVVDLPGTYSLELAGDAIDTQISAAFLATEQADVVVNVVDASTMERGLALTLELAQLGKPMIVLLNMMDVARAQQLEIDHAALADQLGCPVVPVTATSKASLQAVHAHIAAAQAPRTDAAWRTASGRYAEVDALVAACVRAGSLPQTWTERLDRVLLNRWLAFPLFLLAMYLMFLFSINIGSAFIDLFDGIGAVLFVELPRMALTAISAPGWLVTLLADGVGGGVRLVGTFIPVIGALFLALSFLEDSGYLARVAFIVDRLLKGLGLPGKSFVPLIVGFGCNVPAVMATRTLDSEPDRILTTLMAPFMSCGARLTVYALFAAAFFPTGGQNVVFALYLIGLLVAVLSALVVRKHLLPAKQSVFLMEMPSYHWPSLRNLLLQTWQRLRGFVVRAGKAIVLVVIVLNVANSLGTDGSIGNQNTEQSVLASVGKAMTPAFGPMGITEDNWPATVGIFTGIFAKEVVVGTLDALYSPVRSDQTPDLLAMLSAALRSVPENLSAVADQLGDPLGLDLGDLQDTAAVAEQQAVSLTTMGAMQQLFPGPLAAFCYLLFILLYMPCVATIGVIYKELGAFWATFSTLWSLTCAYSIAVLTYQAGSLAVTPVQSAAWMIGVAAVAFAAFWALIRFGRRRQVETIPVLQLD